MTFQGDRWAKIFLDKCKNTPLPNYSLKRTAATNAAANMPYAAAAA
jgi:hypothetical protein